MLQFLPYALAAYGGYKGYQASKDAGGSGLQRLLAGATGAAAGYYGGKGALSGGAQLGIPGFASAQQAFTPVTTALSNIGVLQNQGQLLNLPQSPLPGDDIGTTSIAKEIAEAQKKEKESSGLMDLFNKALRRKRFVVGKDGIATDTGEMEFSPGKVATAIGLSTYLSGAFDPKPVDVYTPTYNLAVAELQKQRGGLKYIDPVSGQEKTFEQPYIPEADPANQTDRTLGPYPLAFNKFNTGGLADVKRFNEGGINYLPSKVSHDENDPTNYVRAEGYVEDGSGTGDKDKDTMLAQLADGEFVTRADGVLGAGIIAGGNPSSIKDMREKGAQYFYEQQRRYKRVFDLLMGSKNAKAKAKAN